MCVTLRQIQPAGIFGIPDMRDLCCIRRFLSWNLFQSSIYMRPIDCDATRDWATSLGAAVWQRTEHHVTTMARHGTLLEFMYQRQCEISDVPVPIAFDEKAICRTLPQETSTRKTNRTRFNNAAMKRYFKERLIECPATSLLGARTRFGRIVRFNNRLLY